MTSVVMKFYNAAFKKIKPSSSSHVQSVLLPDVHIFINGTTLSQGNLKPQLYFLYLSCPWFLQPTTWQAPWVLSQKYVSHLVPSFPFSRYKQLSSPDLTTQDCYSHCLFGLHVYTTKRLMFFWYLALITSSTSSKLFNGTHDLSHTPDAFIWCLGFFTAQI